MAPAVERPPAPRKDASPSAGGLGSLWSGAKARRRQQTAASHALRLEAVKSAVDFATKRRPRNPWSRSSAALGVVRNLDVAEWPPLERLPPWHPGQQQQQQRRALKRDRRRRRCSDEAHLRRLVGIDFERREPPRKEGTRVPEAQRAAFSRALKQANEYEVLSLLARDALLRQPNGKRAVRRDRTWLDFAMAPPYLYTKHAKERLLERGHGGRLRFIPGTNRTVVATVLPPTPFKGKNDRPIKRIAQRTYAQVLRELQNQAEYRNRRKRKKSNEAEGKRASSQKKKNKESANPPSRQNKLPEHRSHLASALRYKTSEYSL